jgi:hypothetical protein
MVKPAPLRLSKSVAQRLTLIDKSPLATTFEGATDSSCWLVVSASGEQLASAGLINRA